MKTANDVFESLLSKGRERKFLTTTEISKVLENAEFNAESLELFYQLCEREGIKIEDDEILDTFITPNNITDYTDSIKLYLNELASKPQLTAEQEKMLFKKYQEGSETEKKKIRKILIEHNLKLVVSIAKKYVLPTYSLLDSIQDGNIGLMKAIERFNPDMGFKFSTYAYWWIKQFIGRAQAENIRTYKISAHVAEKNAKIRRFENKYLAQNGVLPSIEETAKAVDLSLEETKIVKKSTEELIYLDSTIGEDDETELMELTADSKNPSEEELLNRMGNKELLKEALGLLSEKERIIITMRYGLDDGEYHTLDYVGKTLHVTRERVRQIEAKAVNKIRKKLGKKYNIDPNGF